MIGDISLRTIFYGILSVLLHMVVSLSHAISLKLFMLVECVHDMELGVSQQFGSTGCGTNGLFYFYFFISVILFLYIYLKVLLIYL